MGGGLAAEAARVIVGAASVYLLFCGQSLLHTSAHFDLLVLPPIPDGVSPGWAGTGFLLAGALGIVAIAPRRAEPPALSTSLRPWPRWAWGVFALALASLGASLFHFWRFGECALDRALWLTSMALVFALALADHDADDSVDVDHRADLAMLALAAIGALVVGFDSEHLPLEVDGDFASVVLQSMAIHSAADPDWFRTWWAHLPTLAYLPTLTAIAAFGDDYVAALRAQAPIAVVTLVATYVFARSLLGSWRALAAAAILASTGAWMHFGRVPNYLDPVPVTVFGLWLFIRGFRTGSRSSFALSGLLLGIAFQLYYSGRLGIALVAAFCFLALVSTRDRRRMIIEAGVFCALGFAVALGPLLVHFAGNYSDLNARTRDVFLFHPAVLEHERYTFGVSTVTDLLLEHARRAIAAFHLTSDTGTQFGFRHPLLPPLVAPFLVAGVLQALTRLRDPRYALPLAWLGVGWITGAMLTSNPPFWPRLLVLLPPAAILTASGLVAALEATTRILPSKAAGPAMVLAATVLVGASAAESFSWYAPERRIWAGPRTWVGRVIRNGPRSAVYCMPDGPWFARERTVEVLTKGRRIVALPSRPSEEQLRGCVERNARVVLALPEHAAALRTLVEIHPGGRLLRLRAPDLLPEVSIWIR